MTAQERAARAKAALLAAGGRIDRQGNFIAATGLPWAEGRRAIYDLRDLDDGSDGTFIATRRGPRGSVYELSQDMERIRRYGLAELRTELRKELNRFLAYRQTEARIDPAVALDEWGEVHHRKRTSAERLQSLGDQIKAECAEIGTPLGHMLDAVHAAGIPV